jgi:tetratricopeptide (TPR) repeat protein
VEAQAAGSLGNAYVIVPSLRDVDQAQHWFQHSLDLRPESDRLGRSQDLGSLGAVALERFDEALAAGEAEPVLLQHLNAALDGYQQALGLMPADDHEQRAIVENQLGTLYKRAGDTRQALRHYQRAIRHHEARGGIYGAGQSRYNIAILLAGDGQIGDALLYARAALHNYRQAGPGAATDAADAERLIADLEQDTP